MKIHDWIHQKTHKGSDYLGWVDWPLNYDQDEFNKVKELAQTIRERGDVLLVCGIGGSYLGARAAIEFVNGLYHDDRLEIIYIGNTFSSTALLQIMERIQNKSVYLNVISKSGSTTETAVAFRMLRHYMENLYGIEAAAKRIIVTTDKRKGVMHELLKNQTYNYHRLSITDDIGGRFSVFTAVGLLPIACAGIDIDALMEGSLAAYHDLNTSDLEKNPAYT